MFNVLSSSRFVYCDRISSNDDRVDLAVSMMSRLLFCTLWRSSARYWGSRPQTVDPYSKRGQILVQEIVKLTSNSIPVFLVSCRL